MVWLDPFVFLNPSSTDPWHPYLNCREEKEEAPLKTGEEAAPSIYHLSPIGSDEFSLCVPASGWDLWSELWRWKGFQWPEGCQLNFHSSLAMAYQKNGGQTTRKGSNTSCVCFMLLLTTTFSLESPDLRHHRKGQTLHHDLRNLGMKLLAEISPKLSHRVCWRSIAATKTAGKWWFPSKRPGRSKNGTDVPIWLEGLLLMIFSKFATYSLRHVHFQSFSERYTPVI